MCYKMGNQVSMCCSGRSKKIKKGISKELEEKYTLLEDLRQRSADLQTKISPQDGDLVHERFRTTEKSFTDLKLKIGKFQENVGNLGGQLDDIQNEAQKYLEWLEEAEVQIKTETALSFQPRDVEITLKETQTILKHFNQKQRILNGIIEKSQGLSDLPSKERDSMEQLVAMVQSQHNAVYSLATEKCEGLQTALSVREEFLAEINKETEWLEDREITSKKMEIVRLLSTDVKKQLDKYKKFVSKVKSHTSHVDEIEQTAGSIKEECNEESQSEIDSIVSDLRNRFDGFVQSLENQKTAFKDNITARKSFEGDCCKIEKWCDETEAICDDKLPLDCAIELVEEKHKQYKNLSNMAVAIGELVTNTLATGESFKDGLLGSDIPVLQQQQDNIQDRYNRATSVIDTEIKDLESKMEERYILEQKIEECTIWFSQFQQELRLLSKTTPSSVKDSQKLQLNFQDLEKKLAEYKPKVDELYSQLDSLRSSGQIHNVESILSLNNQYEQFIDQISQYENNCQQTMFIRQHFEEQTTTLESSLKQCEDEIQSVNETELPLSERLERYKVISEKLTSTQPDVFIALDKAQQLKIDQSTDDSEDLKKVETIKLKLESMKSSVEEKTTQYKSLQKENDDFQNEVDKNLAWLDEKHDVLASFGSLDLDPEKVSSVLKKHQKLSKKAEEKIEIMQSLTKREKLHYAELQEPLSTEVKTKHHQIETLQTDILGAISRKEEYLKEGVKDREQYKNSVSQVKDWIHGAEDLLDSGYDGMDYDTLDQTLSDYTDYFTEASLCQDEVEQITELSEKLLPTLDINDKETLNQSIANINQKLSIILVNSQNKQELLESKSTEWKIFLENVSEMNEIMDNLESDWEILEHGSVNDPTMVQTQLQSTQEFLEKIEEKRPMIGELNDKSRNLERSGNVNSRNLIHGFMTNVNHRWSSLVTLAETTQTNLKEISSQWEGFSGTMSTVEDILREAEVKLSTVNIDLITYTELIQQVNTLQEVSELLNEVEPQITVMKKSSENLQKTLPTAESKIHSQDTSIALLEKYERISSEAKEKLQTVQDELEDRESFKTDIESIIDWLTVTKSQISSISSTLQPVEILAQIKNYEQEINTKVTEAKKLEQSQETKYKAQGRELPEDMLIQLSSLKDTENEVRDHLKQTSELLLHLKEDRVTFTETLSVVTNWLTNAETELQKPIKNITESMAVHKALISNLDSFKGDLDKLRQKGGDIVKHTSDASEKQTIQKHLSDVNRQWNSVQSKIAEKTRKLNEASELQLTFEESTVNIKQWMDSVAIEIGQNVDWSEFEDVRDDLRNTQRVSKDINQNREKLKSLNPVVKQLNHLIDPDDINKTMTTLTYQLDDLQNQTTNKLSTLQDVNKQVEAYEREMADVTRWLDHAKNVLSARDISHDLKEELNLSQKLLKDATTNKEKAETVMQKYKELAVDVFPVHGSKVLTEICQLEAEVSDRVEQLQTAADEQEQYQTELSDLNTAVLEAQQKLLASPVMASSVEALKLQIAEHDALANQIKSYQERINSVNEKSRQLAERSRHHYPMFIRRRFFPDSSGQSLMSAYNSPTYGSLPLISHAHFDSGIDSVGFTSSRYSDASVQPELSWSNVSDRSINTVKSGNLSKISQSESAIPSNDNITSESVPNLFSAASDKVDSKSQNYIVPPLILTDRSDVSDYQRPQSERIYSITAGRSKVKAIGEELQKSPSFTSNFMKKSLTASLENNQESASLENNQNAASLENNQKSASVGNNQKSNSLPSLDHSKLTNPNSSIVCSTPVSASHKKEEAMMDKIGRMRRKLWDSEGRIPPGPELPGSHSNTSLSVEELSSENKTMDDNQLLELNKSWNHLQKQADAKEKALLVALSNQELYQKSVQNITNKMDHIQTCLFNHQVNYLESLDDQVTEHQLILEDINSIKTDIEKVKQYGRSEESDPEGYKTIKSTLNILTDKIQHLQNLAENKNIELQNAVRDMSNHKVELETYKEKISRLDNWCGDMMVEHSESPLPTDTITNLQQQLLQNERLQEEINNKLHQMSDLAVQCDSLCTMEPPITAEKLRSQLALLQQQLTEFKLSTIEKQSNLRQTIKEVEKRDREMSDYDKNMKHIQQWMTDSRQMTLPPEEISQITALIPQQVQLQKDLVSDISKHKLLLTDISESGQKIRENFQESAEPIDRTEELQTTWDNLQKDLELKKRNLEDSIQNKEREVRRSSVQYRPWTYTQDVASETQLIDVQRIIADLNTSWSELNRQTDDKQLRLDQAIAFQQLYQNAILSISGWLDSAEQKLFSADLTKSTEEQIKENEALQSEIQSLQKEIARMNSQAQDLLSVSNVQHGSLIKKSLSNLHNRVETLESHAQNQATELQEVDKKWKQYQTGVEKCQKQLADTQTLVSHHSPSWSVDDLAAQIQRVESDLGSCEKQMKDLKHQEKELASSFPHGVFPSELNSLQISYMDIQRKLTTRKSELQQFSSTQEQYENLLDDYSQYLQTAESKLKTMLLSATDLHHLKQQLTAHRDFFSDLESHKAMLDHLAEQCSKTVQDKNRQEHSRLTNSTLLIVDQASLHGQKLDRLNKQWSELEEKYATVKRSLSRIEHDIPKPVASGDSLKTIEQKLAKLMHLQRELSNEKSAVFNVVDIGKQLLHSVTCPQLETSIADLSDKWVDLNTSLSHELKRTETLGDELQRFEAEASILASWLATANTKIMSLKKLTKKEKKSIAGVRSKVEKLLEFQKRVENQIPFKNKVLESGHELLSNKTYNTTGLIEKLKKFDKDWETLHNDITEAEKYLHKEQMARMPSRQALQELEDWLEEIKQSLRDDPHKTIKTVSDVDMMLRKYKDYKVELASKQITIDFVNQSILQPQEAEEQTEKVAFAEKLEDLNNQWQIVSGNVNKRLDFLEQLQAQWGRFENNFTALEKWFIEQNKKLNVYLESGREVGAFETRTDIKAIRQALSFKEVEISKFKDQGDRLMELCHDSPGIQHSVQSHVGTINQELVNLEKRLVDLDNVVESRTGVWSRYQSELQAINTLLSQTEYCLNNYQLIGGDVATLRNQVDKLKTRESELLHNKPQLNAFLSLSKEHCKNCEANVKKDLQRTARDTQDRWQKLSSEVRDRRMIFEARLKQWQKYDDEYIKLRNLLDEKERGCNHLKSTPDESSPIYLERCKSFQLELDNIQVKLADLYQLSDDLTKHMDQSTISVLSSRQTLLDQRLIRLRQQLSHHIESLSEDTSHLNNFHDAYDVIKAFLSHAESILAADDPQKSADSFRLESRLEQLKDLQMQFNDHMVDLDTVNNLGYRLALKPVDASRMQELNHKWYRLLSETSMRCKMLQGNVVVHQDFTAKCESWMSFLAQTEQDLSLESAGNLADLIDQQIKCEKFNAEKYSREQVLHGILSDGQQLLRTGEVDNAEQFQQKLHLLAEQWQTVVRRANRRRDIIDNHITQWQMFNDLSEKLRNWLSEKDHSLQRIDYHNMTMLQVKNQLHDINMTKEHFKLKENEFKKVNDIGNILLEQADLTASKEIKVCLAQLEHSWYQVYSQLDEHRVRLEDLIKQWHECEEDIDDILAWLRETRAVLEQDVPENYDDIQRERNRCKDIEVAFLRSEDRRQQLLAREAHLGTFIQSEDMNILHQRIRLMNKQWEELSRQMSLRLTRLDDNTGRWTAFSERVRWFIEWMNKMEEKCIGGREIHVEDHIHKLDTEIKEEMREKEKIKNELIEEGKILSGSSSDIRANDIDSKTERVENKWQHLCQVVNFRERKLQETLLAVKQLDNSTKNLEKWLGNIEVELNTPIVYQSCDIGEIRKHLECHQDLQRDIERHSAGVASVLNLCQVLLHDTDACPTEVEFNTLQTTMESLEKRWSNICQHAPQKRTRIEETWKIWEKFRQSTDDFTEWLDLAESEIRRREANPMTLSSREEINKYQTLQKNIRSQITHLENINKQYRHMAKAGLTDTKGMLKSLMTDVNSRWDRLQQKSSATAKELRQSTETKDEYNTLRLRMVSWLRETELQVTHLEHLSELDNTTKLEEIKQLESEVENRKEDNSRLEDLAALLRLNGDSQQVTLIQTEIQEYRDYYRDIIDRIKSYRKQLEHNVNMEIEDRTRTIAERQQTIEMEEETVEYMTTERHTTLIQQSEHGTIEWDTTETEEYLRSSPPESPKRRRIPGRRTPRSARSPSRWAKHSDSPNETNVVLEERKHKTDHRSRHNKVEVLLENLADTIDDTANKLSAAERELQTSQALGQVDRTERFIYYMDECKEGMNKINTLDRLIKTESGLNTIATADAHIRILTERWERLQEGNVTTQIHRSERPDHIQFVNDMDNMLDWLEETEALLSSFQPLPSNMIELERVIRQFKDLMVQLESKKMRVTSINLISRNYIDDKTHEGRELRDKLHVMNRRYENVCARVNDIQQELQSALTDSSEFHHTVQDLLLWLESVETRLQRCEPINVNAGDAVLWEKYNTLKDIQGDLERKQDKALTLKETADQLLLNTDSTEMVNAKDKTYIIVNRLRALLRLSNSYISSLEGRLDLSQRPGAVSLDDSDRASSGFGSSRTSLQGSPYYHQTHPPGSIVRSRNRSPFAVSRQIKYRFT